MPREGAIQAVLLDWDGTLLDSCAADTAAYLEMFRIMGIGWGPEELAAHYSPDWYNVYRAARLDRERWDEADRIWRQAYAQYQPQLVAGAHDVLQNLGTRYVLGLVTSGDSVRVNTQLRRFGLDSTFAARVCQQDSPHRKPHPEPLLTALDQLGLPPRIASPFKWQRSSAASLLMNGGCHKGTKLAVSLTVARQLKRVFTNTNRPPASRAMSWISRSPVM